MKTGVMRPQVRELPEVRREAETDPSPEPAEGAQSSRQPDLKLLASRTASFCGLPPVFRQLDVSLCSWHKAMRLK